MTYTFKLARRLAVSREFVVLTALALLAACTGDSTAPDAESPTTFSDPAAVLEVTPRLVTIETNQRITFRGQLRDLKGKIITQPVAWVSSGGTISANGTFSATKPGTYKVIGRGRGWKHTDSSTVTVVPPTPNVVSLSVTPRTPTVAAGGQRAFTATATLDNGRTTTSVGVVWSATGGEIDPAGGYTAGTTAGTFEVVATNTAGNLADTSVVSVTAASPDPTPTPTLAGVLVSPARVSLTAGATKRFRAYGHDSNGDSVAVTVAFTATGGTITPDGLYTAGSTAGTYRVVAASAGLADTAVVTLASSTVEPPPPPPAAGTGIPFGTFSSWTGNLLKPYTGSFNLSHDGLQATNIVSRINAARNDKVKLLLGMTGGAHDNYMSVINGVMQFDRQRWNAKMQTFNTAAIKDAIAKGVADGTIIGASVMDEPHVSGGDDGAGSGDHNTWGPQGTMTKVRVDSLCGYVKQMFPGLLVGVVHQWSVFERNKDYKVCDFIDSQYSARMGPVAAYRDSALALGRRSGHAIMFGLNILNGGVQDRNGTWDCNGEPLGQNAPNCAMTAKQLVDFGLTLGTAGCGLLMWRYDQAYISRPDNQAAFKAVRDRLASLPARSCKRS